MRWRPRLARVRSSRSAAAARRRTVPRRMGGTVLATMTLPSDHYCRVKRHKAKSGTWQDSSADATGTAAHSHLAT